MAVNKLKSFWHTFCGFSIFEHYQNLPQEIDEVIYDALASGNYSRELGCYEIWIDNAIIKINGDGYIEHIMKRKTHSTVLDEIHTTTWKLRHLLRKELRIIRKEKEEKDRMKKVQEFNK